MRVLVTTWAWRSHFLSLAQLSWALRAAGHELVVASSAGLTSTVTAAGLPVVALGDDLDAEVRQMTRWYFEWLTEQTEPVTADDVRARGADAVGMYRRLAETSIDDTLAFCRAWRPDLVVFDPTTYVGPLAAAVHRIPAVRQTWGMDYTLVTRDVEPAALHDLCARLGLDGVETLGDVTVDPCPPSLQVDSSYGVERLPMRFAPYNGPAQVHSWQLEKPRKPRIVLLASSIAEPLGDGAATALFRTILHGLAGFDVEILAITQDREPALPPGTRATVSYLPPTALHLLLPHCDLLVHQGGGGTVMTGLAHGVPQLMLPLAADHTANARRLAQAGAGMWSYARSVTVEGVAAQARALLDEDSHRTRARELRAEMRSQPAASQVVASLEDLVAQWTPR